MGIYTRGHLVYVRLSVIVLLLLLTLWIALPAVAVIRQVEEAPGQVVYQSQHTLQDQQGNQWQAIAFKHTQGATAPIVYVRLVGFPDIVDIDHSQPLIVETEQGDSWVIPDISGTISTNVPILPNVGQYDFQSIIGVIDPENLLRLTVATKDNQSIHIHVPAAIVQEWKTIAACELILC